jgi:hypothetical protein
MRAEAAGPEAPEWGITLEPTPSAPSPAPAAKRKVRAAARARPASPTEVGYLSADAVPWAEVWLGDQAIDRTPISRYPLPSGKHVLVFKNPALGKEERRTVTIAPGKTQTLQVRLTE